MIIVKTQQGIYDLIGVEIDANAILGIQRSSGRSFLCKAYSTPERAAEVMDKIERHIENLLDPTIELAVGNRIFTMPSE